MTKLTGAFLIFVAVSALSIFLVFNNYIFINALENKTWDFRVLLTANKRNADKRIKLIDIDQASLDFFEKEYSLTWPLPRNTYNYVIEYLNKAQAKGLAFDMLFTESSAQAADVDNEFALATGGRLPVVSALALDSSQRELDQNKFKIFSEKQLSRNLSQTIVRTAKRFNSATLPIVELIEHSAALGNVQAEPDQDGVFRQHQPAAVLNNIPVLSLPFALYHLTNSLDVNYNFNKRIVRLHGGSGTYDSYSLASIVQSQAAIEEGKLPQIDPSIFKNTWVILGSTAPGLLDLRPTSLEQRGGGLHFSAAVLDNIINNNFIKQTSEPLVILSCVILILFSLVSTLFGSKLSLHILRIIALVLSFLTLAFILTFLGIWMPVVIPFISMLLSAFLGTALQYKLEGKQHKFIRNAFKFYLSPSVVEQIIKSPNSLQLGGQKREITIFFSDIIGFTKISEQLEPQLLVKMLNDYLSLFTRIIQDSGGTLDKFVGDAVMAFWNSPLSCEDHAQRAVTAAIKCQKELESNRQYFLSRYGIFPDTRIGINTDQVSVGNFGSKERFDYTVIGDGVNFASRLEGANKYFGTRILVSSSTKEKLDSNFELRVVADLVVVGKTKAVRVYEPIYKDFKELDLYNQAIEKIENGQIELAKESFDKISNDYLASRYLEKMVNFKEGNDILLWNLSEK